jgi:nitrite reductase/ring-hydroxylating ferredoxin subunit
MAEQQQTRTHGWTRVAALEDVPVGGARSFGGVTVFRTDAKSVIATGSRCPHMGYPMDKGLVRDGVLTCAWHQWEFDLATGGCYRGACHDLPVYPIRIVDGRVEVELPHAGHDRQRLGRVLGDAMLAGDIYQEAKAVAALLEDGAAPREVAVIAAEHGFKHSVGAHRSQQAVVELRSIVNAARLAERFEGRERIGILLQGVRTAGGPHGEREVIAPLPAGPLAPERRREMLTKYVVDPSPLAIERLLLDWPAEDEPALRAQLLDLATAPRFLPALESFIAVVDTLDACDWLGSDYLVHRPALLAWVLGAGRGEPEGEERIAVTWLEQRRERIRASGGGKKPIAVEDLARAMADPRIEAALEGVLGWLEGGVSPDSLLDAFSVLAARRFDHLRPNNGGLWRTATASVRLCHAVRRAFDVPGPHRAQALFGLAWQIHAARWMHAGAPWKDHASASPSWDGYATALKASDIAGARAAAIACAAPEREGALAGWLEPLVREDLDADQLATIGACLSEPRRVAEWQPLIAAPIGYVLENRSRQDVNAAARFGRSIMAGGGGPEA